MCYGYFYHKEILKDIGKAVIAIGRSEEIICQVALLMSIILCKLFLLHAICNSIREEKSE